MAWAEILAVAAGAVLAFGSRAAWSRRARRAATEAALSRALDDCPLPVWHTGSDGRVTGGNARFAALGGSAWLEALTAERVSPPGEPVSGRVFLPGAQGLEWHEIRVTADGSGGVTCVASPADREVLAETRLGRMSMLLTEAFAALPAGVALFDESGMLAMFNPALGDLLGLEPAWLARGPKLKDMMEKLRAGHLLPGLPDFLEWRRMLAALENPGEGESHAALWAMPGGRNTRVTARGLGGGARVLIFEALAEPAAAKGAAQPLRNAASA